MLYSFGRKTPGVDFLEHSKSWQVSRHLYKITGTVTKPVESFKMSLYDGVDIDGVPMQSNSTDGTDITKLCKWICIKQVILRTILVMLVGGLLS